ncbi:MAG: PfkB family carbohydrate kinase [Bifidobacteriaceae bacterium]|jgi:sugar/nucleoside kinase (ribokinase family)|nr:PfkB family carbohydrate kinase [Bifidobacteriaceae bacterium]
MSAQQAPPPADVMLAGIVFCDIIFTGLPRPPAPGQEVWSEGMGTSPGGISNLAVACARLGLNTALASCFSEDGYGQWCREVLSQEGIDLSCSTTCPDWHSPVTVSLAYGGDRALVTHGHCHPLKTSRLVAQAAAPKAVIASLDEDDGAWWAPFTSQGTLAFCDVGWDDTGRWDLRRLDGIGHASCFMPNAAEAQAYTGTQSPAAAARELGRLVELVVVTEGARGATAFDAGTGQLARVPAVPVRAIDPTGAGDVFGAAFTTASLRDWPLVQRLRFAALAAALSVEQFGGSLAAPGWGDIADWWRATRRAAAAGDPRAGQLETDYGFLEAVLPEVEATATRRATATIARHSDADNPQRKGQHEID